MVLNVSASGSSLKMVIAMILAGSIGILVVESGLPAMVVVFYRCLIGGLALLVYCLIINRGDFAQLKLHTTLLISLSGLTMAANWVLFFMAYSYASISMVTTIYHVYPFILIFVSALFFHEKFSRRSMAFAIIAFLGVVFVARGCGQGANMSITGLVLTMAAMLFYAITLLITKSLANIPASLVSLGQLLVGALALLPLIIPNDLHIDSASWGYLLTIGVVHTGLMYVLLYSAVQSLEISHFAILSFLYPLTALAFDTIVYSVRPNGFQIIGLALITFAVISEKTNIFKIKVKKT